MIRTLQSDSGSTQALCEMINVRDIARLVQTCTAWARWISEDNSRLVIQSIKITSRKVDSFAHCGWIQRSLRSLIFIEMTRRHPATFNTLLPLLPRLVRLKSLQVITSLRALNGQLFEESFGALSSSLLVLDVHFIAYCTVDVAPMLSAVSLLTNLETLVIRGCRLCEIDLSSLLSLTKLTRLATGNRSDRCDPAQVLMLSRMVSLTDLDFGAWLPSLSGSLQLTDSGKAELEQGLGTLVRLRQENGAAPLHRLYLGSQVQVHRESWRVLSQLRELEEIKAFWSREITADEWMLLAQFQQLRSLKMSPMELEPLTQPQTHRAMLDLKPVFSALQHCCALRELSLRRYLELRAADVALLARPPALEKFSGDYLRIESLAPLAAAPALLVLSLQNCTGILGESVNMREMIPPLPLLTCLTITDQVESRLTESEAAPFNAALLLRLPRLSQFVGNLIQADSSEDELSESDDDEG